MGVGERSEQGGLPPLVILKYYKFFWQWDQIQGKILRRKPYFEYFFRANARKCVQIKAKNPRTAEFLNGKLTWEIERPSRSDFDLNKFVKYEKNPTINFYWTYRLLRNGVCY